MAANKAAMEESQEEADVSQEEMATRLVSDIITHQICKVRKEITSRSVHKRLIQQETKINAIHRRLAQNMGKKFASKRDKSGKKPTINK